METLQAAWQWLTERWNVESVLLTGDTDYTWFILGGIALAFIAVWSDNVWDRVKFSSTLIHEIGHSVMAIATGRRLHGLKVHSDSSGVSVSSGRDKGLGMLLTVVAGYPAPGLLALLLSFLMSIDYAGMALTLYHTLLIFGLLSVRNAFGLWTVLTTILATIGITVWNNPYAVSITVLVLIIMYGVGGIRGTIALIKVHGARWNGAIPKKQRIEQQKSSKDSDASQAARLTLYAVPTWIWIAGFMLVNVACLGLSILLLLK